VTMRILPGLMPVLSPARLERVLQLSGEPRPAALSRALAAAPTPADAAAVGIAHATALVRDLLAGGAPGIHLYTFNRSEAPLAVLRDAGLIDPHRLDTAKREIPA